MGGLAGSGVFNSHVEPQGKESSAGCTIGEKESRSDKFDFFSPPFEGFCFVLLSGGGS